MSAETPGSIDRRARNKLVHERFLFLRGRHHRRGFQCSSSCLPVFPWPAGTAIRNPSAAPCGSRRALRGPAAVPSEPPVRPRLTCQSRQEVHHLRQGPPGPIPDADCRGVRFHLEFPSPDHSVGGRLRPDVGLRMLTDSDEGERGCSGTHDMVVK